MTLAFKDASTRLRLMVGKDVRARFRLVVTRDAKTRFRLLPRVYKDTAARFTITAPAPETFLLAPENGALLLSTSGQTFSWTYYEAARPASVQQSYALRRRLLTTNVQQWWDGAGWVPTETYVTTSTASVALPANSWGAVETPYAWTVRTKNDLATAGAYDTERQVQFTLALTPTITGPASITTANVNVTWTTTEQIAYRVRLLLGAAVIKDSGKVYSTTTRTYNVGPMANADNVDLEVRVWNFEDYEGPVATSNKTVAYTAPSVPTVVPSTPAGTPKVRLVITNPGGGDTVTSNEVWRSPTNAAGSYVRIATGVAVNGTYDDHAVGVGVPYWYIVRAIGTSDTIRDSAVVS